MFVEGGGQKAVLRYNPPPRINRIIVIKWGTHLYIFSKIKIKIRIKIKIKIKIKKKIKINQPSF